MEERIPRPRAGAARLPAGARAITGRGDSGSEPPAASNMAAAAAAAAASTSHGAAGGGGGGGGALCAYPAEVESGNREYKLQLATCSEVRLGRLTSQLKWRLAEGGGEAVYVLGVEDDGTPLGIDKKQMKESLKKLRRMAAMLACEVVDVRMNRGLRGQTAEVRIRSKRKKAIPGETEILFLGASGVGKTTLVGVLKTDETDDGQGLARLHVLKHQHEMDRGLTSATSSHVLRYDAGGQPMLDLDSEQDVPSGIFTDVDAQAARKMEGVADTVSLIDAAGHPRYFKTAIYGLTAMHPDLAMVIVDAETLMTHAQARAPADADAAAPAAGVQDEDDDIVHKLRLTLDLLAMCKILKMPFGLVVTKADLCKPATLEMPCAETLAAALEAAARGLLRDVVDEAAAAAAHVFVCSSTSKMGVAPLRVAIGALGRGARSRSAALQAEADNESDGAGPTSMYVRKAFLRSGSGNENNEGQEIGGTVIVGGRLTSGAVSVGDRLVLGPDLHGQFAGVVVDSIRTSYGADLDTVTAGHTVTFALGVSDERRVTGTNTTMAFGVEDYRDRMQDGDTTSSVDSEQDEGATTSKAEDGQETDPTGAKTALLAQVARRGACLCGVGEEPLVRWSVDLDVVACVDLNSGAVTLELDASKHHEFTLRSSTLKQRVLCHPLREGGIQARFQARPEAIPLDEPVVLQRGPTVVLATYAMAAM